MKKFYPALFSCMLLCLAWASTILFAMRMLASDETGHAGNAPAHFPQDAALILASDRPTLIMLVQSDSAESRDALAELSRAMRELHDRVKAYVLIAPPQELNKTMRDDFWCEVANIPGVIPIGDGDGRETQRFGGAASGRTLVYSPTGHGLFAGAITDAAGANGDALVRLIATRSGEGKIAPALGYSLVGTRLARGDE